jgi:ankyrin repeat protein
MDREEAAAEAKDHKPPQTLVRKDVQAPCLDIDSSPGSPAQEILSMSWGEVTAPSTRSRRKGANRVAFAESGKSRSNLSRSLSTHMAKWLAGVGQSMSRYRGYKYVIPRRPEHHEAAASAVHAPDGFDTMAEFVESKRKAGHGFQDEWHPHAITHGPPVLILDDVQDSLQPWELSPWDNREAAFELHAAAQMRDPNRIRMLFQQRHVPTDIPNEQCETAALCAARDGNAECLVPLLTAKADPLVRDRVGNECKLHFGDGIWPNEVTGGRYGVHIKKTILEENTGMPSTKPQTGRTVVYWMRLSGVFGDVLSRVDPITRISLVRTIGDALYQWHGQSPLRTAAQNGNSQLARILLEHLPSVPPSVQPSSHCVFQWTPSHEERVDALLDAAVKKDWCTAEVLAAGASSFYLDAKRLKHGMTALHLAAAAGHVETVRSILSCGASPLIYNSYGRQSIHEACVAGHAHVVKALLDGDADPHSFVLECHKAKRRDLRKNFAELAESYGHKLGDLSYSILDSEVLPETKMHIPIRDAGCLNAPSAWTRPVNSKGKSLANFCS